MGQDKVAQEFWQSSQPHRSQWYCFWRLETFSFVSMVMVMAVFSGGNTGAIAFSLNEQLPHNSTSLAQNPIPFLTLPPAVFPTNQPPAVSVPTLQQPIPPETFPPATPTQPLEPLPQNVAPAPNSSPVVEFGQPLPKTTTSTEPASTPQSAIPTLDPATTNLNPEIILPSEIQSQPSLSR